MCAQDEKKGGGGLIQDEFQTKLAAMRAEDAVFEEGKEGAVKRGRKKQKPRRSATEAEAKAEVEAVAQTTASAVAVSEAAPVEEAKSSPAAIESRTEPLQDVSKKPAYVSPEEAAEKLVKAMGFSNRMEEPLPKNLLSTLESEADLGDAAAERRFIIKYCPDGIAVRAANTEWDNAAKELEVKGPGSNLDGEASIFFLKRVLGFDRPDATPEEKDYIEKIHYVPPGAFKPGCLNLDTSWKTEQLIGLAGQLKDKGQVEGAAGRKEKVIDAAGVETEKITHAFDHHGFDSPRLGSTLETLYDYYRKVDPSEPDKIFEKVIANPREREAWKNFIYFVSAVDSLVIPDNASWKEIWENSDRNLFAVCVAKQNLVAKRVESLFKFFRTHDYRDGFTTLTEGAIERILGPISKDKKTGVEKTFAEEQIRKRNEAENFYNNGQKHHTLFSKTYGKVLVVFGQDLGKDERGNSLGLPGKNIAAFAHGYDAALIWRPEKNEFHFNVRSNLVEKDEKGQERPVSIPYQLYEDLGQDQAVWTRGGMLFQPGWRSQAAGLSRLKFGLEDLLGKLGVDTKILTAKFKNKISAMESVWEQKTT